MQFNVVEICEDSDVQLSTAPLGNGTNTYVKDLNNVIQ
jgi:hypothetical protein